MNRNMAQFERVFVGIAGMIGAGKSTLARTLGDSARRGLRTKALLVRPEDRRARPLTT